MQLACRLLREIAAQMQLACRLLREVAAQVQLAICFDQRYKTLN